MSGVRQVTLKEAEAVVAAVLSIGSARGLKPLTVAVLDAGGHLIALHRQDGASTLRPQIAISKAAGALGLGVSSREIGEIAAQRPSFVAALGQIAPHGMTPTAGGVIMVDGAISIGAIGVTGDTSDNDEYCALEGLKIVGIAAQGGSAQT